ncbi:MAG: 2-C-methyl-D-erythritol 2,4-cyclodiphosphate synthase [Chloroflexota bacterium]|nr:2-C-methyl-D-erythritol 2,4-cyclodiphosphate synthase [Chloroflexota bacterium]
MRIGIGFDIHPLVEGRKLVIGGVAIDFERGLMGHSDADVLVHAIIDTLLGAAAMGDIGKHFPDTDQQYKDMSSLILLERVGVLLSDNGFAVENIDATVICERPRLADHIDDMCRNIAKALGIERERVSVKASTANGLGDIGKGEGIAAMATALVRKVGK